MTHSEIVYATQRRPWMAGKAWCNARFFTAPEIDVTRVYVVGDYPAIAAAYEAKGVVVFKVGRGALQRVPEPLEPPSAETVDVERTDQAEAEPAETWS